MRAMVTHSCISDSAEYRGSDSPNWNSSASASTVGKGRGTREVGAEKGRGEAASGRYWTHSSSEPTSAATGSEYVTTDDSEPDGGGLRRGEAQDREEEAMRDCSRDAAWAEYIDAAFANKSADVRAIWCKIPANSFFHLTTLPLAFGESPHEFARKMREGEYLSCMHQLESFRANIARKYGFDCDGHRAAGTQLVVFCLVYAQFSTEHPSVRARRYSDQADCNEQFLLLEQAKLYTQDTCPIPLWDKKRLRAWTGDSLARYYCLRGKFSGALPWASAAIKAETDPLSFAVYSQHAAFILSNLKRHHDAVKTLEGVLQVLDDLRRKTLHNLTVEERKALSRNFGGKRSKKSDEGRVTEDGGKSGGALDLSWSVREVEVIEKSVDGDEHVGEKSASWGEDDYKNLSIVMQVSVFSARRTLIDSPRAPQVLHHPGSRSLVQIIQDVLALTAVTLTNLAIEHLHIFRVRTRARVQMEEEEEEEEEEKERLYLWRCCVCALLDDVRSPMQRVRYRSMGIK